MFVTVTMDVESEVGKTVVNIDEIDDELVDNLSVEELVKLVDGCVEVGVTSTVDVKWEVDNTLELLIIVDDIELSDDDVKEPVDELTIEVLIMLVSDCVVVGVAMLALEVDITGGPKLKSKNIMVSE